ncbi:MAG TPA: hypothetical protein VFA07_11500 [Chthonomonadaceae bacterium]|nr:hypothetical protein [Chthonomonadaceae bacterium]
MGREFDPKNAPRNEESFASGPRGQGDDEAIWRLLNVYADGEATPEEAAQVEALLRADPARYQDMAFLRLTAESARSLTEVEPPETLRQAIFAATIYRPTLAQRVAAGWNALCRTLASPAGRTALPAGALAAAGIAALILLPRPAAHLRAQIASLPDRQNGALLPALPNRREAANRLRAFQKPSELALVSPGVLGTQELVSAVVASLQSATAARPVPEKAERLRRISNRTAHGAGELSDGIKLPRVENVALRPAVEKKASAPSPPSGAQDQQSMQVATYAFQPGMDTRDQHLGAKMETDAGTLGGPDVRVSSTDTASSRPDASPPPQTPRVHWGHLIVSELPPSPSPSLAEMKRGHMAATLGYDRETLEHIERHQAAVSVIGSRF